MRQTNYLSSGNPNIFRMSEEVEGPVGRLQSTFLNFFFRLQKLLMFVLIIVQVIGSSGVMMIVSSFQKSLVVHVVFQREKWIVLIHPVVVSHVDCWRIVGTTQKHLSWRCFVFSTQSRDEQINITPFNDCIYNLAMI